MAWVGHTVMQAVQSPQWSLTGGSTGSGRSVKISPRKKKEPASRLISKVCLPRQPMPDSVASATSVTGAESVNTRKPCGASSAMRSASFLRRKRNTL